MENEVQNQNEITPEATEASQPTSSNDLSINDLAAMKNIIDVASSRGAFKPNEMLVVGQTYNKLTTFLNAVSKGANNGS